jgi:hypothetical protein
MGREIESRQGKGGSFPKKHMTWILEWIQMEIVSGNISIHLNEELASSSSFSS